MASKFKSLQTFSDCGVFICYSKQKSATKSYELSLVSKPPRMRFLYFIRKVEIDINTLQVLFDKTRTLFAVYQTNQRAKRKCLHDAT